MREKTKMIFIVRKHNVYRKTKKKKSQLWLKKNFEIKKQKTKKLWLKLKMLNKKRQERGEMNEGGKKQKEKN